jgi:hypothetical protein
MPPTNSYVTSATITGGKIALTVRVDDFPVDEYVEVSGHATQSGGAFANFYDIRQVPKDEDPKLGYRYVTVATDPIPPQRFREDQDVTVVLRVAMVWLTVLGGGSSQVETTSQDRIKTAQENTTWGRIRQVSDMNGGSWTP